jgi:hypothetical protein
MTYIGHMTARQLQDPEVIESRFRFLPTYSTSLTPPLAGKVHVSRSRVIAVAIRRFLDEGGVESLPTYPDWP